MIRSRSIAFGIMLFAIGACQAGCSHETAPAPEAKPPKVTVSRPSFSRITDEDTYTGYLRASEKVDVRSRVRGHIQSVDFRDGDLVKKDQLLFELDPRPFKSQIDQAMAQARALDAQRASLQKDVDRYTGLVQSKAITQQQLDQTVADLAYAQAQMAAKLEEAKGLTLDLEYARITAPIAGKIGRALLTEGNLVNAGGTDPVLATINAIDSISLYFSIDEPALQKYLKVATEMQAKNGSAPDDRPLRERGIRIRFGLETDDGFPHEAVLDFVNNEVDPSTGTIQCRAKVPNPNGAYLPGYRVRVRVASGAPYDATLVPETAVNTDQDRKFLLVVDSKGTVKRCDVRLGRVLDDGMQVVAASNPPLQKDTQIIVEGMQRARLNYPVEPVSEPAPTQTAVK